MYLLYEAKRALTIVRRDDGGRAPLVQAALDRSGGICRTLRPNRPRPHPPNGLAVRLDVRVRILV